MEPDFLNLSAGNLKVLIFCITKCKMQMPFLIFAALHHPHLAIYAYLLSHNAFLVSI